MSQPPLLRVSVADGKYTVIQEADGRTRVLRHGEPWDRNIVGDGLILALAYRVAELEENIKEAQ